LNPRPLGYEPNELPDCSTPRHWLAAGAVAMFRGDSRRRGRMLAQRLNLVNNMRSNLARGRVIPGSVRDLGRSTRGRVSGVGSRVPNCSVRVRWGARISRPIRSRVLRRREPGAGAGYPVPVAGSRVSVTDIPPHDVARRSSDLGDTSLRPRHTSLRPRDTARRLRATIRRRRATWVRGRDRLN
jgi:hypothetical protein